MKIIALILIASFCQSCAFVEGVSQSNNADTTQKRDAPER